MNTKGIFILLIIVLIISIPAVTAFDFFGLFDEKTEIECKNVEISDTCTMDVPINATYKKEDNGLEYYESDVATLVIFNSNAKPVDKITQDEISGGYIHELVYEDESTQEGAEIIGGLLSHALGGEKMTKDDVLMFYDKNSDTYSVPRDNSDECFLLTSKDPDVIVQLINSIEVK